MSHSEFAPRTALAVVVANMVGTGVFTSLGYQLVDIQSPFVLIMLWVIGGLTALCGALTYGELVSRIPRSGGEYHFLSQIYHPAMGFVSGWVSLTVGFAAPTALAAMTFAAYLSAALDTVVVLNEMVIALILVALLTFVHGRSREASGGLQDSFTFIKILLILCFCTGVVMIGADSQPVSFLPVTEELPLMMTGAFAVSLIYVNYAYTGWNAATYITSELSDPQKELPRVLIGGTLIVMVLYVMLNAAFLFGAPMEDMTGQIEVGVIVARHAFGEVGGIIMGCTLSLLLVSTVSAMVMAGPRVLQVIGEDYALFSYLGKRNDNGVPTRAIYIQAALTSLFIVTSTFESILVFSGFLLGLNSLMAVVGVFVLRFKQQGETGGYQTWLYPLPPIIFTGLTVWTLVFIGMNRPVEVLVAGGIIVSGLIFYFFTNGLTKEKQA